MSARRAARPRLRELAARLGIVDAYLDQTGRQLRHTSDASRETLLAIMGFEAPTEDAARGWLAELDHEEALSVLEPVVVVERDAAAARRVAVRLPPGISRARVRLTVVEEQGRVSTVEREVRGRAQVPLAQPLPYGYHRVEALVSNGRAEHKVWQSRIVVPSRCTSVDALLGRDRVYGVVTNLYAARREADWGIGDFTTLMQLVEWGAPRGAEFVGMNPLHALFNRGADISPYSPVSRLFRNHIYIDVDAVPSVARSERLREIATELGGERATLRALPSVDYDRVIALKERVLREAHREFHAAAPDAERDAFERFAREREPELTRFATWMCLAEDARVPDWRAWPAPFQDADSRDITAFRAANAERVDFHRWLQFETWRQLGEVAARAQALGMRVGTYQDLAIGTNPGGSDAWSHPELFLRGAAIGAPPDPYSSLGQNWGLPPLDPRALRRQSYRYWIQLLRRAFEHAGALRIDHVMGLFRVFWIPDGLTGREGAYVRFPAQDLLGILALESVRNDAIVVGEDLGTVPEYVPPAMKKWGILSSKVLYFEKDRRGFKPAARYPTLALATANTHDMATIAGFWKGADVEMRNRVGLVTGRDYQAALTSRVVERRSLLQRTRTPLPRAGEDGGFTRRLTARVHDFLCTTRARLVGVSWDDLLGETEPVNVPGVGPELYPSWRRRNRMTVEEASWRPDVDEALGCARRRRNR